MPMPPDAWASDPSAQNEQPPDQYVAVGFVDNEPLPAKFLNWALGWIDSMFRVEHDPDTGAHTDVNADSLNVGGGYGGSGATISGSGSGQFDGNLTCDGELTHGTARNSWVLTADGLKMDLEPNPLTGSPTGWRRDNVTISSQNYEYIALDSGTTEYYRTYKIPVPAGATLDYLSTELVGLNSDGGFTLILYRTTASLVNQVTQGHVLTTTIPAAGAVGLTTHNAATIAADITSAIGIDDDVYLTVAFANDPGTPITEPFGMVFVKLAWKFTQPGDF